MQANKLFYGWILAVILGVCYFIANGSFLTAAAISGSFMQNDIGLTGAELGMGTTVAIWIYGLGSPVIGFLIAKIGARYMQVVGGVLMIICSASLIFFVNDYLSYIVTFGIMAFAVMSVGEISVDTLVPSWFHRLRGRAMTLTMVIGGFGAFGSPLIANALMGADAGHWRNVWWFFLGAGVLAIILAFTVVRNRPEDMGLLPDGDNSNTAAEIEAETQVATGKPSRVFKTSVPATFKQIMTSPAFWLLSFCALGGYFYYVAAVSFIPVYFQTSDLDQTMVAAAVSSMGLAMMAGKFFWGVISDRVEPARLLALCNLFIVVGLIVGAFASNAIMPYLSFVLAGFGYGGMMPLVPTVLANFFGRDVLSRAVGIGQLVFGVLSGFIATIGFALGDATGSLVNAFYLTAVIVAVCGLFGLFARPPKFARGTDKESD
ncbi:MAG: MFS transporter [Coriobacteriales bacterium]|jgi:MFS family permease|nr:MFS transporter [Coriobacteriales bacterium]